MYYNSNKSNNDYYNSYKKELLERAVYKKEEDIQKIIKLLLSIVTIALFFMATFYLYKYFNPKLDLQSSLFNNKKELSNNTELQNIIIREEDLPQSLQLRESNMKIIQNNTKDTSRHTEAQKISSTINEKDIALIVQIIMSQMNTKVKKPLEEQLEEISNKNFINKHLNKTNHYNKVVLNKNEVLKIKNSSLMELNTNLENIVNEGIYTNSNYAKSIKKEVRFRENEMRIIIVKEGDTLSKIAKKAYGEQTDYQKIFSANPEIIKNPNQIFIGQRLRIPS